MSTADEVRRPHPLDLQGLCLQIKFFWGEGALGEGKGLGATEHLRSLTGNYSHAPHSARVGDSAGAG